MGCNNFSSAKVGNTVHSCEELKASLWLRHTTEYSYVNAYNLGVMATLAYSRVRPPEAGEESVGDVADFYTKCFKKFPFRVIKKELDGSTTGVKPLFRYAKTASKDEPLIEKNEKSWYVDTADGMTSGDSTEAFFWVDDENAVLSVRGTSELFVDGAVIDMDAVPVKIAGLTGYFHRGFATQAQTIIDDENFDAFAKQAKSKKLFVTGHSLGGAVATILAAYLKEQGCDPLLYTYGSPRVGDYSFVKAYSAITHYRHVYHRDLIPMIPTRKLFMSSHDMIPSGSFLLKAYTIYARYANDDNSGYLHHGTLCQIAKVGSQDMILPFKSHGVEAETVYKYLTDKYNAHNSIGKELPIPEWEREQGGTQAEQYLLNKQKNIDLSKTSITDNVKDDPMVGELNSSSLTDHFMKESYLPFFEKEIKNLWSIFKNNNCNEALWFAAKRYESAIVSIEEKEKLLQESLNTLMSQKIEKRNTPFASADLRERLSQREKDKKVLLQQLSDLDKNKRTILSYKQKKIGTKTLYSLYTGDPELNLQLDKF